MHLPRLLALALSLAALFPAPARAADEHVVNLTPAWKVGQLYTADVTSSQTNRVSLKTGAQVLHDQTKRTLSRLRAEGEALEVFENGGLKKTRYTVGSLRVTKDDQPEHDFLPAGTEIIVERNPGRDEKILVAGQPATDEQTAILSLLISTDDAARNDQLIFGPKMPVAIGASWPIDTAAFASNMESSVGKVGESGGTMKLDAFEGKGAAGVATVSGQFAIQLLSPPLPANFTFKSGKAEFVLDGRIPMSRPGTEHLQNLTGTVEMRAEAPLTVDAVGTLELRSENEQRTTLRFH